MSEKFEINSIVEGKVTAIKPFGAFIALDEQTQGLVHISQISHGFVKDIQEAISVGDVVKVKIMAIDEATGKISLSIREAQPAPESSQKRPATARPKKGKPASTTYRDPQNDEGFNTFEDKLKHWLKQSNENQEALNKRTKK